MNDEAPRAARPSQNRRETLLLEAVKSGSGFDADVFNVIEERDNKLIEDQLMHGSSWEKFVYNFRSTDGTEQTGVSVVGAAHLVNEFGGFEHKLIASVQKVGEVFTFTAWPQGDRPLTVTASVIRELADTPDYYECMVEISDIKKANKLQATAREYRFEWSKKANGGAGAWYERRKYQAIAESKAYRNCALRLMPQDFIAKWKVKQLAAGKGENITESVIEQKYDAIIQFATAKGLKIDIDGVRKLQWVAISGLSEAAREGGLDAFVAAAKAAGIFDGEVVDMPTTGKPADTKPPQKAIETNKETPVGSPAAATQQRQPEPAATSTGTPTSPPAAQQATPAAAPPLPSTEPPQAKRGKGTKTTAAPDQQQAPTQQQEMLSPPPAPAPSPNPPSAAAPPAKDNPFKFG